MNEEKARRTIAAIVEALVRGDYQSVERMSNGNRLSADEMRSAVEQYGRKLVFREEGLFPRSVVEVRDARPARWNVYVDLWTKEEGRSDLTLELSLIDSASEKYGVEIDDIHVL